MSDYKELIAGLVGLVLMILIVSVGMYQATQTGYKNGQYDYARGVIKYYIVTNIVESVELKER